MKNIRIDIFRFCAVFFFVASLLSVSGCSFPSIVVLHDPLSVEEHDNLGRIYESQGKFDLAIHEYHDALKKDKKHVPSLLLLGDLSYRLNNYSEAESAYRKVVTLDPGNSDVRNNLAWVYIRTGSSLDKAKELITQALRMNPGHRPFYLDTLGVILLKQGNVLEAIAALRESVATLPKDRQELTAEALMHLVDACKASEDEASERQNVNRQRVLPRQLHTNNR